jgi:type I restriction enzyme S subunit
MKVEIVSVGATLVATIEAKASPTTVAEAVEQQINRNLKRAEHLRQSILKRAFSGQLVPQDPNDQPVGEALASTLIKER